MYTTMRVGRLLADSEGWPREDDIQIAASEQAQPVLILCSARRDRPEEALRNSNEIG
jgi:hypothetical protein